MSEGPILKAIVDEAHGTILVSWPHTMSLLGFRTSSQKRGIKMCCVGLTKGAVDWKDDMWISQEGRNGAQDSDKLLG